MKDGTGSAFDLRMRGYARHKRKAASAAHVWEPLCVDVFKRPVGSKPVFHVASKLTLPPPPGGKDTPNCSGLPRLLVTNTIVPVEGPSLVGDSDGPCYQIVIVFGASADKLQRWSEGGSAAAKLFQRFSNDAPEGLLPVEGDLDIKERLKLVANVENMNSLGLGPLKQYNGEPAVLTKSGSVHRGDDYIEIGMNTCCFGYFTKKVSANL